MSSVIAVRVLKCAHRKEDQRLIRTVQHNSTLFELFEEIHGPIDEKTVTIQYAVSSNTDGTGAFQSEGQICVGDLFTNLQK